MKYAIGIYITLALFALYGWVLNITKLVGMDWAEPVGIESVLRIVGIVVAPLGIIMGYAV